MTTPASASVVYAGLTADDPRVKAALAYVEKHYTLDENPGMGQLGLYYHYPSSSHRVPSLAPAGRP